MCGEVPPMCPSEFCPSEMCLWPTRIDAEARSRIVTPETFRYSRRFQTPVRAAGTAALFSTVGFECPNNSKTAKHMKNHWQRRAGDLCSRINADHRNHLLLNDPWSYRAHIIVQSWRIRASQGNLNPNLEKKTKATTWKQSAERMRNRIHSRRQSRLRDKTTWSYWANHLPQINLRYVPKRKRPSPNRPARSTSKT